MNKAHILIGALIFKFILTAQLAHTHPDCVIIHGWKNFPAPYIVGTGCFTALLSRNVSTLTVAFKHTDLPAAISGDPGEIHTAVYKGTLGLTVPDYAGDFLHPFYG